MSKTKILTIVYDLGPGGTQRAAENFSIAFKENNYDVRALGVYELGVRQDNLEKLEIPCFLATNQGHISELKSWSPDIIHIHRAGSTDQHLMSLIKNLKGANTKVVETNVFSWLDDSEDRLEIDIHFHLSPYCYWKWELLKSPVKKYSRAEILPYFVKCDPFYKENKATVDDFKRKYNIPTNKKIVGRIGQPYKAKWDFKLFDCVKEMTTGNDLTHFLLIGAPKNYVDEAKQRNLNDHITFIDFVHGDVELRSAFSSMDVFLHIAEIGESFGMVLAESLLCETPIVCLSTPRRDNTQLYVVPNNQAGYICNDIEALCAKTKELLNNSNMARQFGAFGRQHILDKYSKDVLIKDFMEITKSFSLPESHDNLKSLTIESKKMIADSYGSLSILDKFYYLFPKLYMKLLTLYLNLRK